MKHRGLIPFTWEDVKLGDKLIHKFRHGSYKYVIYLGICVFIYNDGEIKYIFTDKQDIPLNPSVGGRNIKIDRRTFLQRVYDKFFC